MWTVLCLIAFLSPAPGGVRYTFSKLGRLEHLRSDSHTLSWVTSTLTTLLLCYSVQLYNQKTSWKISQRKTAPVSRILKFMLMNIIDMNMIEINITKISINEKDHTITDDAFGSLLLSLFSFPVACTTVVSVPSLLLALYNVIYIYKLWFYRWY